MNERLRAALPPDATFVDLAEVSGQMGRQTFYDPRRYFWTKQPFSEAGSVLLAEHLHAAVRAVQYYPEIRAFYRAKKRKKPEKIARTLVALEIARIVYHVLSKQQDFNGRFKGKPLSRKKQSRWPRLASPAA